MRATKKFFTAVFLLLTAQFCFILCQEDESDCYDELGRATRCVSPRRSFSFGQRPRANSTCGSPPAMFCSREVNILLSTILSNCNQVCDANDEVNAHPTELMTDFILNVDSWWQSENSLDTQHTVVIDLPLDTLVEMSVITFDFVSIIPRAFRILKSEDFGETFVPLHFLSSSCADTYGINPDQVLSFSTETSLLCQRVPLPPNIGRISFFPAQHRPSSNDSVPGFSEALYNFITATDIRVILEEHAPIDNLPPDDFGYYYAIEDFNVVGSCQCFGHASSCSVSSITGEFQCNCQHNTTGTYCESCAEFYQDIPWSRADGNGFQECKACNCNSHSLSCVFDEDVYEQSGQTSGGVCLNCTDNTNGRQCERCVELYYPQPGLPLSHPNICVACDCNLDGVSNNGTCTQEAGPNGVQPGDCSCKQNTQGRTCGQCIDGFFNLSAANPQGCQECQCNSTGSIDLNCNQATGICTCKPNIIGDKCEECRLGYYLPEPNSLQGCQPCNCNLGGSLSEQCDLITGQCPCRRGVTGPTCSDTIPGYFFPDIDFMILEAESATNSPSEQVVETSGENVQYTGTGYYRATDSSSTLNLGSLTPPVSGMYEIVLRYNLRDALSWESVTVRVEPFSSSSDGLLADCGALQELDGNTQLNYTSLMMGVGLTASLRACLRGGRSYTFELQNFISGLPDMAASLDIDSLVLILVDASNLRVFKDFQLSSDYSECVDSWRSLLTQPTASPSCEQTTFAVSTAAYNGTLECDCDEVGTLVGGVCQLFGGQCPCLPGVRGRQCDQCSPGFFNLTFMGCTRCECDADLSQNGLCDNEGQCECLNNTIGRDCSSCAADHWLGNDPENGCIPCTCDVVGSVRTQCDIISGECPCEEGVSGMFCDQCSILHFGFSDSGCSQCNCSEAGSTDVDCNIDDGQCSCKSLADGRDCSECQSGTFNLQATNPDGCQTCFCSGQSSTCTFAEGFVRSTILSDFDAAFMDPLVGWEVVDTSGYLLTPQSVLQFSDEGIIIPGNSELYLRSPDEFLGNRLSSYGQFIELLYETNTSIATPTLSYDVIVSGNGLELGTLLATNITGPGSVPVAVQLHETAGWMDIATNIPATANDMQLVLYSLDNLTITGGYDEDITLRSIAFDIAVPYSQASQSMIDIVTWVEQCECPTNYTGFSCDECATGYTRSPIGSCELCQCNGFSTTCDQNTGECFNCSLSTTGENCERCIEGTFGDPSSGIDCRPCPCPLSSGAGQFTNDCVLTPEGEAMCRNCPEGHTGLQCETCLSGFFGDPTGNVTGLPTGCSDCQCNGNIDTSNPDSCNQETGLCTRCLNNTTGDQCERCADGFYGDAIDASNCTACECDPEGSNGVCDPYDGRCECYPNVIDRQCNQCAPGHYGLTSLSGCQPCNCQVGAVSLNCDENGQCTCQPGVTGATCDQCLPGFFGLSSSGCEECSCSQTNAEAATCDANGQCICRLGSTGSECEQCLFNYYETPQGCTSCPACYQELEGQLNVTREQLNMNAQDIQAFLSMISSTNFTPFDSRLLLEQQSVDYILQQAQLLANMEDEQVELYGELLVLINQTLVTKIVQTNASLDDLKAFSTTVFVLATTSMELVNYTIRDILQTMEILNITETVIVPSVQSSVNTIQTNLAGGRASVEELMDNVNLLSQQLETLSNITNTLMLITATVLENIEQVQMVTNDTTNILNNVRQLQMLVEAATFPLDGRSQSLGLQLMTTASQIQEVLDTLVPVPSADQLRSILSNANTSQSFAMNITVEISSSQNDFNSLNATLTENLQELENLQGRLTMLQQDISTLLNETQDADFRAMNAERLANFIIEEGELILDNLQNFSNNSLQVALKAAEALQAVSRITTSAQLALEAAENIENRIGTLQGIVTTAKINSMNARIATSESEQNIRGINTTTLLSSVTGSLNSSLTSQQTANDLLTPVTTIFSNFQTQSSRIDQVMSSSIQLARNQTNESESLRDEAVSIVDQLDNLLESLSKTDQQTIDSVEALIMNVDQELTNADIELMYNILYSRLQTQIDRRIELEAHLENIQPILEHLRFLSNSLPSLDCDG